MLTNKQRAHDLAVASVRADLQHKSNEFLVNEIVNALKTSSSTSSPHKNTDCLTLYKERYNEYLDGLNDLDDLNGS